MTNNAVTTEKFEKLLKISLVFSYTSVYLNIDSEILYIYQRQPKITISQLTH